MHVYSPIAVPRSHTAHLGDPIPNTVCTMQHEQLADLDLRDTGDEEQQRGGQRRPRVLLGLSGAPHTARRPAETVAAVCVRHHIIGGSATAACPGLGPASSRLRIALLSRTRRARGSTLGHRRLCAGSVATIKAPLLCQCLCTFADVKVIATSAARYFVREEQLPEEARPLLGVRAQSGAQRARACGVPEVSIPDALHAAAFAWRPLGAPGCPGARNSAVPL